MSIAKTTNNISAEIKGTLQVGVNNHNPTTTPTPTNIKIELLRYVINISRSEKKKNWTLHNFAHRAWIDPLNLLDLSNQDLGVHYNFARSRVLKQFRNYLQRNFREKCWSEGEGEGVSLVFFYFRGDIIAVWLICYLFILVSGRYYRCEFFYFGFFFPLWFFILFFFSGRYYCCLVDYFRIVFSHCSASHINQ